MSDGTHESPDTRQRVLEAAGEVFAEKGFEKATIREIVDKAGANLNAVNYYFRDKRGLYVALFEHAHSQIGSKDAEEFARVREQSPEMKLRAMIIYMLRGFILSPPKPWQVRLVFREITEPTGVLEMIVERLIRPRFEIFVSIVKELAPTDTPLLAVQLCAESVVAQCVHITHKREVVGHLIPELTYTPEGIEAMADHITAFSVAAIRNMAQQETQA